jgi:hypothetical protein
MPLEGTTVTLSLSKGFAFCSHGEGHLDGPNHGA